MFESADVLDARWERNFQAAERRRQLKERAVEYLGGKCQCCGYDRCLSALEFHHADPSQKEFQVSSKMAWDVVRIELDKCFLLCRNCHSETHAGFHPQFLLDAN